MKNTRQLNIRLSLPAKLQQELGGIPPRVRRQIVAALLASVSEGVNLHALTVALEELRRVGVLLNQACHLAHMGKGLNVERVEAAVKLIDRMRGKQS
ncbi:MAG: hypothetical protein LBK60_08815 [Verrucomicrobiales bacterium]|jgi:hypothetical protein|nr:hypothetical protein [Verrucomicrobiales bacterium]